MTRFLTSLLRRYRKGLLSLLTCGGVLSTLLMVGAVGVPLALVSQPAMAACTPALNSPNTYYYNAANINQSASLPFQITWTCANNGSLGNSQYVCYGSVFTTYGSGGYRGRVSNGANHMTYTVQFSDGTNSGNNMRSDRFYGPYYTPVSGSTPLQTTFTVNIAANQAGGEPPGIYSDDITFAMDEQGANGPPNGYCEENTGGIGSGGWDSGSVTYTANFVIIGTCNLVSTSTVDFGNIPGANVVAAGGIPATGAINVNCSNGTPYTVYLGDGNHRVGSGSGYRRMANGTALLPYQLYQDSGHTTVWDASCGTAHTGGSCGVSGVGTGTSQNMSVYALIPGGTTVPAIAGAYTDSVVVTVTY
jgi:spore coat protein U-like protein